MRGDWPERVNPSTDAPASVEEPRSDTHPSAEPEGNGKTAAHEQPRESAPAAGADGADVQGDIDELVRTAAQRDEYLALAQRTQADFENYRKRVAKESRSAAERGAIGLARELLPALDNLDRALGAAEHDDPLLEGVKLVRSELAGALARSGIESFSPVGESFDPALHEAVATAPQGAGAGAAASGTVVEVYQPGYRLGESVIRPARVVVAA